MKSICFFPDLLTPAIPRAAGAGERRPFATDSRRDFFPMKVGTPSRFMMWCLAVFCVFTQAGAIMAQSLNWMKTTAPSNYWDGVVSSSDGTRLFTAGYPSYYSTNSGGSWQEFSPALYLYSIASSADGTKLVGADGGEQEQSKAGYIYGMLVYYSTNSGTTWNNKFFPFFESPTPTNAGVVFGAACSADGATMVAAGTSDVNYVGPSYTIAYISTNFGNSWLSCSIPSFSVANSATIAAMGRDIAIAGADGVVVSTNGGSSFRFVYYNGADYVASSPDASLLAIADDSFGDGLIRISTNWGASWSLTQAPSNNWTGIALAADDKTIAAASAPFGANGYGAGQVYVSTNSGFLWSTNGSPSGAWDGIACSADGQELIVAGTSISNSAEQLGSIYISQNIPSPTLSIAPSTTNMTLSWLLPSTNVILQQNPGLIGANWQTVTNAPSLNYSNLQYNIAIPISGSSGFYRLVSQ